MGADDDALLARPSQRFFHQRSRALVWLPRPLRVRGRTPRRPPRGARCPRRGGHKKLPDSSTGVYQAHEICSPLNGDNQINVILVATPGVPIDQGVWKIHLTALKARDGSFDAWIERDSMQAPACMSSFVGGSYVRRKTLGSIQSSRFAITVSNYDAFTTTLADSTSYGPTRDGRRAPTVAAPGTDIRAAKSLWRSDTEQTSPYTAMTGTSMAAPYVAGLIACMLEKDPQLTAAQIRSFLTAQAKPAPGIGDEWRIDWGHGRVDPIDTLQAIPEPAPPV